MLLECILASSQFFRNTINIKFPGVDYVLCSVVQQGGVHVLNIWYYSQNDGFVLVQCQNSFSQKNTLQSVTQAAIQEQLHKIVKVSI